MLYGAGAVQEHIGKELDEAKLRGREVMMKLMTMRLRTAGGAQRDQAEEGCCIILSYLFSSFFFA